MNRISLISLGCYYHPRVGIWLPPLSPSPLIPSPLSLSTSFPGAFLHVLVLSLLPPPVLYIFCGCSGRAFPHLHLPSPSSTCTFFPSSSPSCTFTLILPSSSPLLCPCCPAQLCSTHRDSLEPTYRKNQCSILCCCVVFCVRSDDMWSFLLVLCYCCWCTVVACYWCCCCCVLSPHRYLSRLVSILIRSSTLAPFLVSRLLFTQSAQPQYDPLQVPETHPPWGWEHHGPVGDSLTPPWDAGCAAIGWEHHGPGVDGMTACVFEFTHITPIAHSPGDVGRRPATSNESVCG